jgi:diketogulonate reductase-like aldo/keto reductase
VHVKCLHTYTIHHLSIPQELERLKAEGLVKHIGVSNFNERQIQRLLDNSNDKPEALQVIN